MSKKAGVISGETRKDIIKAAEKEFAGKGYQGASLRQISGTIGLTTGAVYFFFSNKDDLFQCVIRQVTDPFMEFMKEQYKAERDRLKEGPAKRRQGNMLIAEYMLESYFTYGDVWKIIAENIGHEAVKEFIGEFVNVSADHYMFMLESARINSGITINADRFDIEQYVHMQLRMIMSLALSGFNREQMAVHMEVAVKMLRAGFFTMISE